jgi:hypothetical protein
MAGAVERAFGALGAVGVCVALAACGGEGGSPTRPEVPKALAVALGAGQSGVVATQLPNPIGIKVTGESGQPLAGVTVYFALRGHGGSLSASSWKTNASGIASVSWTLGQKAGANVDTLDASVSSLGTKISVTASATAASPKSLDVISGNAQVGSPGEQATEPLAVEVRDAYGNPNAGIVVSWTVDGGGTLSAAKDTTDANGRASVVWTLGAGNNVATATVAELSGVRARFAASLTASGVVVLDDVSPDTLVEGGSATLTGTGFSASIAGNKVYVDGVPAVVTSATGSSIDITVPALACKPTRSAPVRVVVGTEGSNAVQSTVVGNGTAVNLAMGEQLIVRDPAKFCLQLAPNYPPTSYLVGVQSVSGLASSITPVTLSATTASDGAVLAMPRSGAPLTSRLAASGSVLASVLVSPDDERWRQHRAAEVKLRMRERQIAVGVARHPAVPSTFPRISASQVMASAQVGDTIPVKFPDISTNFCSTSIPITTVVRAVGTKGIWLEDVENPANGYTAGDFTILSNIFDNAIYASDVAYFGAPTDLDDNGRIVIVTTKEVNKRKNVLGFAVSTDLYPTSSCAASNEGEFYYGRAPDPTGLYQSPAPYALANARKDAQILIAHEFTHVIQFGRRLMNPGFQGFQSVWEMEGQATLAQEVVGNDLTGRTTGQNYGPDVAFPAPGSSDIAWYSPGFTDLALYYGFKSQTERVATAPEQCSWLDQAANGNTGPCISGREVYGVPWLFLRWLSDQFGPSVAGGEAGVQKALIDNTRSGYENVENVTGVKIDTLLAQWAAALYLDDRWPSGSTANPRLGFKSWNLHDIYAALYPTAQPTSYAYPFQSFSKAVSVRGGSTAYFTINGSHVWPMALALRDASGNPITSGGPMQLWIVRLD